MLATTAPSRPIASGGELHDVRRQTAAPRARGRQRLPCSINIKTPLQPMSTLPADRADHTAHHPGASLAPVFTPHGRLTLIQANDAPLLEAATADRLQKAFARGSGHGLLQLGAGEVATALPAVLSYWRDFAARYVTTLCTLPDAEDAALWSR